MQRKESEFCYITNLYVLYYSDKNMNFSSIGYIHPNFIMCMKFYIHDKEKLVLYGPVI
jgi:hypothetical protein